MNRSRLPLLGRFVVLDALGVASVLLDGALGGGWAADALAVGIVLVGVAIVVVMTVHYLDIVDNPAPEPQPAEPAEPGPPTPPRAPRRFRGLAHDGAG
jgi:hypothetical protein